MRSSASGRRFWQGIAAKMALGPGLGIVTVMILVIMATHGIGRDRNVLIELHDRTGAAVARGEAANSGLLSLQAALFQLVTWISLNGSADDIDAATADIDTALSRMAQISAEDSEIVPPDQLTAIKGKVHTAVVLTKRSPALGFASVVGLKKMIAGLRQHLDTVQQQRSTQADAAYRAALQDSQAVSNIITFASGALVLVLIGTVTVTSRLLVRAVKRLTDTMTRLAAGDYTISVAGMGRRDEIGAMAAAVQVFKDNAIQAQAAERAELEQRRVSEEERLRHSAETSAAAATVVRVVDSIGQCLERLAAGDLTSRQDTELPPAYETLRTNFNKATEQLLDLVRNIVISTEAIRSGTGEIANAVDDLSQRTETQAASLQQTAAALDEITTTVNRTADSAKQAQNVVAKTRKDAEGSGDVVRQAVAAMANIEASSYQISQIISVIDEIAFQTNLLALNAGVEAARAGEAGRGFAVVASEVRALAQRSADAAKQIKEIIMTSAQQVGTGVRLVDETGQALGRIVIQVNEINDVVCAIAISAAEQASGLKEVNTAVNQMDQATQQNASMVEETTTVSRNLAQETSELVRLTGQFNVESLACAA